MASNILKDDTKIVAGKYVMKGALLKDVEKHIIGKERKPWEQGLRKSFELLFQATKHGCSPDIFHTLCDGKGPTVTILYGKGNVAYGGYTSQSWHSSNKVVSDDKAFLFLKEDFQQAKLITFETAENKFDWAITCNKLYGPTFGGGQVQKYDLQTFKQDDATKKIEKNPEDNCFKLNGSLNFNTHYRSATVEASRVNGLTMVTDIEVFQVKNEYDSEEWRQKPTDDDEVEKMKDGIKANDPKPLYGISAYNVLLLGQIGSGKTSFYNTLATAFSDQIQGHASAGSDQTSVTNKLHEYEIKRGVHVRIFDIRGYEEHRGYEFEISHLLDGKLKNGYEFPEFSEEVPVDILKKHTSLTDEIHVVCFVEDVTVAEVASNELNNKFIELRKEARKRELPIMVISTKFDSLCPVLKESPVLVYRSPKAEESTRKVAGLTGVSKNLVFPIINYTDDLKKCQAKDMLALQALCKLLSLAEHYVKEQTALTEKINVLYEGNKTLFNQKTEEELKALRQEIEDCFDTVKEDGLRILCIGDAQSGKSSFIDSVLSAASGTVSNRATGGSTQPTENSSSRPVTSLTKKFRPYPIKFRKANGEVVRTSVEICDMPGFQKSGGIQWDDIKYIIQGHVPGGYRIDNHITKKAKEFIKKPEKKHRINCVCLIIDVTVTENSSPKTEELFKKLKVYLQDLEIPYIAVLTKIDVLLRETVEEETRPEKMKRSIDIMRGKFQLRRNLLFHVKNYVHESDVNPDIDSLILDALKAILKLGEEGLENMTDAESSEEEINNSEDSEEYQDSCNCVEDHPTKEETKLET